MFPDAMFPDAMFPDAMFRDAMFRDASGSRRPRRARNTLSPQETVREP